MTMDYSPCPEREIWPFLKGSHISKTEEAAPTKIDVHAHYINSFLDDFSNMIQGTKDFVKSTHKI